MIFYALCVVSHDIKGRGMERRSRNLGRKKRRGRKGDVSVEKGKERKEWVGEGKDRKIIMIIRKRKKKGKRKRR